MEKTDRAAVVEGRFRWSDIGSWDAVFEVAPRDAGGNAASGPVLAVDAKGCIVHAEGRLTAVLGVEDLIVVSTPDAVLVLPRARAEDVKSLVAELQAAAAGRRRRSIAASIAPGATTSRSTRGDRFQVKRIVVVPGGKLSLQKHHHRAEHWVVVRGTAEVTVGDEVQTVHENEFDLHPDRLGAPARQSGPDRARADRGADRQLSRRGRHRPARRRLPPQLTFAGGDGAKNRCGARPRGRRAGTLPAAM